MPCYQIVTVSVEFKVESAERLKKALEKLGFSISEYKGQLNADRRYENFRFDLNCGTIMFKKGLESRVNEIKREYSKVTLEEIAKKKKWLLKSKGANKFQMVKY